MSVNKGARWFASALAAGAVWCGLMSPAEAIPVFARQTGHNCQACHISYPELTAYGRDFKLNGYTFGVAQPIPLAIATMQGITSVSNNTLTVPTPAGSATPTTTTVMNDPNSKFEIMQSSIFGGGRFTDNIGAFIQWTWSGLGGATHSGMDNTEVRVVGRYTPEGQLAPELVYGLNINNNMTMQDVWMGVPAWRFPWWGVGVPGGRTGPPGPVAATEMEGALGQRAVGIGAYAWWRKTIYAEVSFYRKADGTLSFLRSGDSPTVVGDAVDGYNPYLRVAYSHDWGYNSVEVGGLFTHVRQHWDPTINASNTFNDFMVDAQYQYNKGEPWVFGANASYIHESASYDAQYVLANGSNSGNTLREFFLRGTAYYDRKYGASIGYTNINGTSDAGLYGFNPNSTTIASLDGSPASNYFVFELNYLPLQDLRFTLQYFLYNKLNGVSGTDTFGNKVGDANTLFAGIWWDF